MPRKQTIKSSKNISVSHHGAPLMAVFNHVHKEIVKHCAYCGKPMTRSDVNDYGSLCERCYLKEYY